MKDTTPTQDTPAGLNVDIEKVRRVVTGLDDEGRSTAYIDEYSPHLRDLAEFPTFRFIDLWTMKSSPGPTAGQVDDADGPAAHVPPAGGNIFRILEVAPDPAGVDMAAVGMHVTATVDYLMILSGEVTCVLEDGEVDLRPGDVLVQRATNHAWSNRGTVPCLMLIVLSDGELASS